MTEPHARLSAATEHEPLLKKLRFTLQVMKRANADAKLGKPSPAGLMSIWDQDVEGVEEAVKILSCGAESNRHSGAVGADKRAEQSNPGGGHEVTDSADMKHMDVEKPLPDEPTPAAGGLITAPAQSVGMREALVKACCASSDGTYVHAPMDDVLRAIAAQLPAAPVETKTVYVKRWRTLVNLPAKYAGEIVEALRATATPVETAPDSDGSLSEGNANVGDRIGRTRRPAHPMDTISGGPIGPSDTRYSAATEGEK